MKKTLATLTILIITCAFSPGAFAGPEKQGKGLRQDRFLACMNLTAEQQKQLRDLHQIFVDDTYEMRSGIMNLKQQIRMYMETSHPNPAKLKSMVMEKADLEKDLDIRRLEFALDARKISPELKYMPMGMGPGFGGYGKGYGHGYHGFGKGAGFYGGPQKEAPPENN
ncbi:MAG: periplasmic heavy metal sensor [Desulfobacterales bacterium]|nr:periplasmic heavy metal sensor [Desulfobacterales bacterium]